MTRTKPLTLGFSPCPNDTFIFCRLVEEIRYERPPLFQEPALEDVETLNKWAFTGTLDVTKLSFHAAAHLLDSYCILSAGGALGRGCGPLLVGRDDISLAAMAKGTVAIPGTFTTAALLFKMFLPGHAKVVEMRFEQIMEAVAAGIVDGGVIIHEGRFTYQRYGLVCLQDLGEWWEDRFDLPIPLGCIAAKRDLGHDLIAEVDARIRASLVWARSNPGRCSDYVKLHAQETEDAVIDRHIGLYVNDFSLDLGEQGRSAVTTFIRQGQQTGALPVSQEVPFCAGAGG